MQKVAVAIVLFLVGIAISLAINLVSAWFFMWIWNANVRPAWHVSFIEMYLFMVIISASVSINGAVSSSRSK